MGNWQATVKESEEKMKKSLEVVQKNFSGVRTGRANSGMVEHLKVDYYGTPTPLRQVANITVPEPRMIMITPWDVNALKPIEKAILDSDLGISPIIEGKFVRIAIPPLTRERREEMVKIVHKLAEEGHVAVRAIRRDYNDLIKKHETKDKILTEDESRKAQTEIQKLTDRYVQLIDQAKDAKEKELTQN